MAEIKDNFQGKWPHEVRESFMSVDNNEIADIFFLVGNQRIPAYKQILAMSNEVLFKEVSVTFYYLKIHLKASWFFKFVHYQTISIFLETNKSSITI